MKNKKLDKIKKKIESLTDDFCNISFKKKKFIPGETDVLSSGRVIDRSEIKNLIHASLDGWLTSGRFNRDFQDNLAKYLKVKYLIKNYLKELIKVLLYMLHIVNK